MAPKKNVPDSESNTLLVGFTDKETKLLAAAFVSCIGTDRYDYDLMATLTKNTAGSLKKMWPPVKKKASENYASFAKHLSLAGTTTAAESKAVKKRKAAEVTPEVGREVTDEADDEGEKSDSNVKSPAAKKSKRAPATRGKGRVKKGVKKEVSESEVDENKTENNSEDGSANSDDDAEGEDEDI
ncbi:hypothetical protein GMOD_00008477 [Pyrenophora seminiperda CCB06]|uniref:Uncharacterized protein n=1 Tax=Pyrenophora seminiperda CCB06 TaxID=1302712 RepID=A0A3M7M8L3_9PLEO|nr:hypothetical protein GMOD_00008477 [Pyrenophora seminiperda CCB06]